MPWTLNGQSREPEGGATGDEGSWKDSTSQLEGAEGGARRGDEGNGKELEGRKEEKESVVSQLLPH